MTESNFSVDRLRSIPEVCAFIDKAAQAPLFDAAYLLYRQRFDLKKYEREAGLHPPAPESDLSSWDAIKTALRQAYARVLAEKEEA
jgi:hypothetical protein